MRNKNLLESFACAWAGVCYAYKTQRNLIVHTIMAVLVLALGVLFGFTRVEMAILAFCCAFVIACELINTAIEKTVDLAMPDISPAARCAKDLAAAAVLVSAIGAAVVGLILFLRQEVFSALWGIIISIMKN